MSNIINLKKLFQSSNKSYETNIESKIEAITPKDESFFIDIINNNICYQGFSIMKSKIFPEPNCYSPILIKKISYRFDEIFKPRLYINASLISQKAAKDSVIENKNIELYETLDFYDLNIGKTLQNFLCIKQNLISNLFIVNSINEKEYSLELFKKKVPFILEKTYQFLDFSLNMKDIIYISDYYLEENNIKLTQISLIEKLSEEKLFILLQEKERIFRDYLWGKIIEKDEKNKVIRIMDKNKDLLTMEKYNDNIKLGQYFIFSNFVIDNNMIKLKEDKDDSFYYYSGEELYFSTKIRLNLYSVIQFHIVDFNNDIENYYKEISIDKKNITKINKNQIEIICDHLIYTNNKLIPTEIGLIQNEFNKSVFFVKILQGLLNKINVFVNYFGNPSYYFEYLCTFFNEPKNILETTKTVKCKGKIYTINIFDNFNSNNRIRFNIMNIPIQKDFEEYLKKNSNNSIKTLSKNSFLVCETFKNDNSSNIYGIFDIFEIILKKSFGFTMKNKNYNSYYFMFGGIYDELNNNEMDDNKAVEFLKKYENMFKNVDYSLFKYCLDFENEITKSELKSRIGILICYYFRSCLNKKEFRRLVLLRNIQHVIKKIEIVKEQLTNSQILRIFSYLLRVKIQYNIETEILLLSKEKNDSAYLLAQKFILEEIDNLNEFSKLFQGYLQMDSYVLFNYKINAYSYSLSIEPIFIVKYHLKSNYEGFFILEEKNDNILGWTEPRENITIINEKYLFEKSEIIDPSHIQDEIQLKHCAFGITIVLRHEDNSHKKKNLDNKEIDSPLYYCEDGESINITKNNSQIDKGEDGILIESLITKDYKIIISLAKDFIYGELLDYRLFIQKDFSELLKKINEIKEKHLSNSSIQVNNTNNNAKENYNRNEMRDMHNFIKNDEGQLSNIAKEAIRNGILKLGDVFYTLDVIQDMVLYAENNNSIDQLYPIFIEIDKELKKDENYKFK